MDDPLFFPPAEKKLERYLNFAVLAFAAFSVLACVIHTANNANHFFLGLGLAGYTASLVQLVRWYRLGDLDPKFKYLLAGQAMTLILLCIVANIYVW